VQRLHGVIRNLFALLGIQGHEGLAVLQALAHLIANPFEKFGLVLLIHCRLHSPISGGPAGQVVRVPPDYTGARP